MLATLALALTLQQAQPDVLFIAVDDLNDWITPLGGSPQAKTPNFERLAKLGVCFTNAHCAAPACHPSRVAVMTGVHPSRSGIYRNSFHQQGPKWREASPTAQGHDALPALPQPRLPRCRRRQDLPRVAVDEGFAKRSGDVGRILARCAATDPDVGQAEARAGCG